jgi:hypothetical protein
MKPVPPPSSLADHEPHEPHEPGRSPRLARNDEIKVLEALDAVIASGVLGGGERLPALLRYLVTEELAGRGERIKGFAIATEVLGRGPDFDPQLDSIARTEMTRLRKALDHVAASNMATGPVRITIPKGSYRPRIDLAVPEQVPPEGASPTVTPAHKASAQPGSWRRAFLVLAVLAVTGLVMVAMLMLQERGQPIATLPPLIVIEGQLAGDAMETRTGPALRAELAAELARQRWLTVVTSGPVAVSDGTLSEAARQRHVFLLDVQVTGGNDGFGARVFLKRWPDRAILWSNAYVFADLARARGAAMQEVAGVVARDLTLPGGGIMLTELALRDDDRQAETRFSCLLAMRHHWRSYDAAAGLEAERCLTEALEEDPAFVAGRGALASYLIERARGLVGEARAAQLAAAEALIAAGPAGDPLLDGARMGLAACRADVAGVRQMARDLAAAYPNNPDVLSDAGSKLGLAAGEWAQAVEMEARAMMLNPLPDPWYPLASLTHHLINGEPHKAMGLLEKTPQRGFVIGQIARLVVGAALQDGLLLADARKRLGDLGLDGRDDLLAIVEGQCWTDATKAVYRKGVIAAVP